ncbi:MAG: hypothetical protein WBL02_03715 [Methanomethylovorans sp.]
MKLCYSIGGKKRGVGLKTLARRLGSFALFKTPLRLKIQALSTMELEE